MASIYNIHDSLEKAPPTAPPAWANAFLFKINESMVAHSGGGELSGGWHSQNSDEALIVLSGTCIVHTTTGTLTAGPGSVIRIDAGEPHRVETSPDTRLIALESGDAQRTTLPWPHP